MSKIDSIKNITVFQDFSTTTDFYQKFNINNQPDECIIRSISYSGYTGSDFSGSYLIWSDMINDYICSFGIDANNMGNTKLNHNLNICPQIHILFKQPVNFANNIKFVLHAVDIGNHVAFPSAGLTGEFAMNIDFITYKK